MKTTVTSNIEGHFSDEEQHNFMLLVSCLDPRFSKLKFLPSRERADVYTDLGRTSNFYQGVVQEEEEQDAVPKVPKPDSLLEYHESGIDSNGSSPATASDQVEKEIVQYKAEAEIDSTADSLAWWKLHHHRYPLLSVLERKFLCITAIHQSQVKDCLVRLELLLTKNAVLLREYGHNYHAAALECANSC